MKKNTEKISCHLKRFRMAKGWSQTQLADMVGVKRQAVYDIEAGRYLPNTLVALRLAKHLECSVEDLFESEFLSEKEPITLVDNESAHCSRVAAARVRGKLIGIPLGGKYGLNDGFHAADGLLDHGGYNLRLLCSPQQLDNTILLFGCDPAFSILASHLSRTLPSARLHCRFASSHKAVSQLSRGFAHIAGTHLHNKEHLESNVEIVKKLYPDFRGKIIAFSTLEEGLLTAPGNPLGIRSVNDFANTAVRLINREPGAALRVLLDDELNKAAIPTTAINGYTNEVLTHLEGALMVGSKAADIALGFRAIADAFNLGFIPVAGARCDLVVPDDMLDHPIVKVVLDTITSGTFRLELGSLPGYGSSQTGTIIASL
jgi:putative molybdopterin biosynthesis protein